MKTRLSKIFALLFSQVFSMAPILAQHPDNVPVPVQSLRMVKSTEQSGQSVTLVMGIKSGISKSAYESYMEKKYDDSLAKRRKPGAPVTSNQPTNANGHGTTITSVYNSDGSTTYQTSGSSSGEDTDTYLPLVEGDIVKYSQAYTYCLKGGDKLYEFRIEPSFYKSALYQVSLKKEFIKNANAKALFDKMNNGFVNKGYSIQQSGQEGRTIFYKGGVRVSVSIVSRGVMGSDISIEYADARRLQTINKDAQAAKAADAARMKEIESIESRRQSNSSKSVSNDLF